MNKLCKCGKMAIWCFVPSGMEESDRFCCDDCVPRGCSCNEELKDGIDRNSPEAEKPENWIEVTDGLGRKFPCVEWDYNENGYNE